MRVILKPAGMIFILVTLVLLVGMVILNGRWQSANREAEVALPAYAKGKASKQVRATATPEPSLLETGELTLTSEANGYATAKALAKNAQPSDCTDGIQIVISRKPEDYHHIQIRRPITGKFNENRALTLRFWARSSAEIVANAGNNWQKPQPTKISAFVGERDAIYTKAFFVTVTLGPVWKEHIYTFSAPANTSGKAEVRFFMGYQEGELDLAGVRLQ